MTTTSDARWALAVVAAVAGVGLAVVGLYELVRYRSTSTGLAGAAQPQGLTMPYNGLTAILR